MEAGENFFLDKVQDSNELKLIARRQTTNRAEGWQDNVLSAFFMVECWLSRVLLWPRHSLEFWTVGPLQELCQHVLKGCASSCGGRLDGCECHGPLGEIRTTKQTRWASYFHLRFSTTFLSSASTPLTASSSATDLRRIGSSSLSRTASNIRIAVT